ncbi:glyoxylate reductase/hydroxypyruvate reductase-like [Clytia hemisphaerica]|uniref:Glyoxylate reductase/hydroxypyruvate reductase n=1 Tax=Clytia hemisphaerica TaxID=252671 RepID=A0A7M6DLP6_9CNID|eukprot:TCONS_00011435-protein
MSQFKRVFIGRPIIKEAVDIIKNAGFEVDMWEERLILPTEDEMCERSKGVHGLYTLGPQKVTKKILDAAGDQLKVVSAMSVGVDAIDLVELKSRGIRLGHTPGVLTDAVAELAVGLLLSTSRRIIEQAHVAKSGHWSTWDPFGDLGCGLRNSTVGIVGLGRIGSAVARRLVPFGVSKIVYNSRSEKPEAKEFNAQYLSFDELLAVSDFVICCCSMNDSSKELFNESAFSKMKSSAILVNIGRGGMVDQNALVKALQNNQIRGAGLDVTTPEPLPKEHPLYQFPNVCILPHIGSAEIQTRTDMATMAARNLVAALTGEKMPAEYPL